MRSKGGWLKLAVERESDNGSQSRTGGRDQEGRIPLGRVQIAYAMQVSVWSSGPIEFISIINNPGILIGTGPYSPLVVGEDGPFHVKRGPSGMNESHACCFPFGYAWRQLACRLFEVSQKYAVS